jgi:hypothetical protein
LGFKTGVRIGIRFPMSIPSQRDAGPDLNTETLTRITRINTNLGGICRREGRNDQYNELTAMTRYYSLTTFLPSNWKRQLNP